MPLFAFFDPMYFLILAPGILLSLWASFKVRGTFARWARVPLRAGLSGAQAASMVLGRGGASAVRIEPSRQGGLSDHYDPRGKVLRLSGEVFGGRSVASVAVAAHEAGHALQDRDGYAPLALRSAAVPMASLGSSLSGFLIMGGVLASMFIRSEALLSLTPYVIWAGIVLYSAVVAFQLITLPVEFNASRRARERLVSMGIVTGEEEKGVKAVLDAAALTYVAAALTGLLTLLYFLLRFGGIGGRND